MTTPEGNQISIFITSKGKKAKNSYGIYPTEFQPKIIKKIIDTPNQPIETKKSTKKSV
jgi:hypothetical protein